MSELTYLPGKDAALEETIARAESALLAAGIETEVVSWLNPIPDCWSVHLRAKDFPWLYTNGKGCSKSACYASALGEFLERLSSNFFFTDFYLEDIKRSSAFAFYPDETWWQCSEDFSATSNIDSSADFLSPELLQLYNPDSELTVEDLQDNNTAAGNQSESTTICTLPFTRLRDQKVIHFPVCLLNNLYVSNGMAAGNSLSECRAQAVAEIIERYVKNIIIAKGISLPGVPRKLLQNRRLLHIVDALHEHGFSVHIKDASLGGRFPVICVLLIDPASKGAYAAFGASCRFEVAIERTLTELLQGRNLDALHNFALPTHDLEQVADPFNLESHFVDSDGLLSWRMFSGKPDYAFAQWDFSGTTEAEYRQLCTIVCQAGFDLYWADYSHFGMYCCRILIPGMSEIYPVDDIIYNNRNRGSWLRTRLLLLPGASDHELNAMLEELETAGFQDQQKIGEIIGVFFDQNSCWHSLRVGELKTMLHLALGNREDGLTWALWCVDHGQLDGSRQDHYRLISSLLGWQLSGTEQREYHNALRLFFSEEEIRLAEEISAGKMKFHELQFGRTWREISKPYAALLDLYVKLQACKI